MKLYHIKDIDKFCSVLDSCEGKVTMLGADGAELNLKSKLAQFVALSRSFGTDEETIPEMEVITENPKDTKRLIDYMISA